jgi:DNA-binding CsgD family transcriptional regulator
MAGSVQLERAETGVRRICESASDTRSLRLHVLDLIRAAVEFDSYAWLLTDPETAVGSAPLAAVPDLSALPSLIRLKYLTTVNRWTALTGPVLTLNGATAGDPARSRVWREILHRYDVVDVASCVFRDRFGWWGFLDLWRSGGSDNFDAAECGFLRAITGPLTTALRRCQADTFRASRAAGGARLGPVVLLLSPELEVRAQTAESMDYLRQLVPPAEGRAPVPAGAYNVAAQLLAAEEGVDRNPPWARVHLAGNRWLTVRAARLGDDGALRSRDIAVTIEEATAMERLALFARAFGLTHRETELLEHLTSGADTRYLAGTLYLSEHTVHDHLKSIFSKTGANSRSLLLAWVRGH